MAGSAGYNEPNEPIDVHATLAQLPAQIAELVAVAQREHERAAFRESIIDRLHADNERLRRGELEALLEPVRSGLFRVHDLARGQAVRWRAAPPDRPVPDGAALLDAVADEAADVLIAVGVERFEAAEGEAFDQGRHRPVGTVPVAEQRRDNTVAQARSAGFQTATKVVRRADVVLARYEPAVDSDEGSEQP